MDKVYFTKSKKNASTENGTIVYTDEASFRQNPTLHQTWAPLGQQPKILSKGQRNTQKVFGAIAPKKAKSIFTLQEQSFNHKTYIDFLDTKLLPTFWKKSSGRVYLIQDNASYHKKPETYDWFKQHRKYIEVSCLPPYHPELNAEERIWWYVRKNVTHNRYYEKKNDLQNALVSTFSDITKKPYLVKGLVTPYL